MTDQLNTIDEAAHRLRLKPKTMRRWVFLRKLNYVKVGSSVRIPKSEINRIIEEGTVTRVPRDISFLERVAAIEERRAARGLR